MAKNIGELTVSIKMPPENKILGLKQWLWRNRISDAEKEKLLEIILRAE